MVLFKFEEKYGKDLWYPNTSGKYDINRNMASNGHITILTVRCSHHCSLIGVFLIHLCIGKTFISVDFIKV